MTLSGTAATEERREILRAILREDGTVDLAAASEKLDVHPMTVRRDLDYLEREGIARRVRGGAVYVGVEDFHQRQGRHFAAKRRIAEKLVPLIKSNQAIGFDASTTVFQLASALKDVEQLSVITNGLATFTALQHRPGIRAYLTGGESEEQNASLVGPLAVASLSSFLLNTCFLSTTCIDPVIGTSEPTMAQVEVKKAMADASQFVVIATDSSKLGTRSVARALPMARIDLLVTELDPKDPKLDPFRDVTDIL